jgi:hypothetical protein
VVAAAEAVVISAVLAVQETAEQVALVVLV